MYIFKTAVVGAGTMGAEIAQVISSTGLPVLLKDVGEQYLGRGMSHIQEIYLRQVRKGRMSQQEAESKLALVKPTLSYEGFDEVDLVVEAVPERFDLKKRIFEELAEVTPTTAIMASNTSSLPISSLGAASGRPHKVLGLHFFNPAHVMELVEIIPGLDTDEDTLRTMENFAEGLRKTPIVVRECPGFLVNRLLTVYLNEATHALEEGLASAEGIDRAMTDFGWPMGPFALMDMVGLDVAKHVADYLYQEYGERFRPGRTFDEMVAAGKLGKKSGRGFYDYSASGRASGGEAPSGGFRPERLIYPMINEAVRALQENIAPPADIDLAMVLGTGMTYHGQRMGPLQLADTLGLDEVLLGLEDLLERYGVDRFRPTWLLKVYVNARRLGKKVGRGFHEYV